MDNGDYIGIREMPKDFDRSKIVRTGMDARQAEGIPLYMGLCDYDPIKRNHFSGWFAIPDVKCCSARHRTRIVDDVMKHGGTCLLRLRRNGRTYEETRVTIIEAFRDGSCVVIHIEPAG